MNQTDRENIRRLISVLNLIRAFNPDMPLQHALAFLHIAAQPGINITELAEAQQTLLQSASRHAHALAGARIAKRVGLVAVGYGVDGRTKALLLTDEGRRLSNAVAVTMSFNGFNLSPPVQPVQRLVALTDGLM